MVPHPQLPADPLMPGTAVAWNHTAMLTVFRNTFDPNSRNTWTIEDCKVARFRYRPELRSIVLYEITLKDSLTDIRRCHWVTGSIYPNKRARRRYEQLLAEGVHKVGDLCGWPFDPVAYLSELRMLLQVYPVDRYLPTLPAILRQETSAIDEVLFHTAAQKVSPILQRRIEPTRYRPSFGTTLRYSLDIECDKNQSDRITAYVKVYREASAAQAAFGVYWDLSTQSRALASRFQLISSTTWLPEHRALILPQAPGRPLEDLLKGTHDTIALLMRRTATAVAALHTSSLKIERVTGDEQMIAGAQRNAEFIEWAYPVLGLRVRKLAAFRGSSEYAPTHMDLKPDHVFLDDDEVTFIDLDSVAMADPVYDIAMLAVRLWSAPDVYNLNLDTSQLAVRVLLESYFEQVPNEWRTRWPTSVTRATLKVALFYIKHQLNNWPSKVEAMIALAETTRPYGEAADPWS